MVLLFSGAAFSQVSTGYTWSQSFQTYKAQASTTSATPADIFFTGWDDEVYTTYTFPFNFTYNGILYTAGTGTIGIDTDGWVAFSTGAIVMTGTTFGGSWVSATDHTGVYLNGTGNNNGFCGFNSDVEEQVFATFTGTLTSGSPTITGVSDFTNIRVGVRLSGTGITDGSIVSAFNAAAQTVTMSGNAVSSGSQTVTPRSSIYAFIRGIAPYRQYVIQWTRASRYSAVTGDDFSFQLVLNEGGGIATYQTVQAVYGTLTTVNAGSQNAQVGLRGNSAADFNARTTSTNWSATTTAAVNTATCSLTSSVFPISGLTYTWSPPCSSAASAAGVISGTNPVCPGTSADYSIPGVPGAIFYNWTYTGGGTTLSATTTLPLNTLNFGLAATGGTLTVTPGNLCGNGASSSLAISVTSVSSASISYPLAIYCQSTTGTISPTLTGPAGGTYTSSPSGLSMTAAGVVTPSTSTAGTYTITYTYNSGACSVTTTTTLTISPNPLVTVTATPSSICTGGNSQLSAAADAGGNYNVASVAYSALMPSGSPVELWGATYGDEQTSAAISLPFPFSYYGQNITQFFAYPNGYISLQTAYTSSLTPQALPNPATPNNVVALCWDDLEIDNIFVPGAYVRYFVNGTAPNRVMVIEWNKAVFYLSLAGGEVSGQVRLYESDNHIEVAVKKVDDAGLLDPKTLGIENSLGTVGITPAGRNNAVWNVSNEAWSFTPKPVSYLWTPSTFLSSTTISNPIASAVTSTTVYNVKVTDVATGCFTNGSTTVTVGSGLSGTYTVGATGNYPTLTAAVNAYNTLCISGPVIFSLIDNTYPSETFPVTVNSNIYASSTNTLTIKPAAGKTPLISGSSAVAILKLNGADYVTIDGSNAVGGTTKDLTIVNTSTNSSTSTIVWLASVNATNGATNNTIKNCNLTGNAPTTTFTSVISSGTVVGAVAEAANSNNTYTNNKFIRAQTAIAIVGPTGNESGNIISNNTIGSTVAGDKLGWSGIETYQQANCQVTGNTISGITSSNSLITSSGISVFGTANGISISGNRISDVKHTNTAGFGANGIWLTSSSTSANVKVFNNMIFDIAGYGYNGGRDYDDNGYGMIVSLGAGYDIYYNTVNLNSSQTVAGFPSCFNVSSTVTATGAIRLKNNIFNNSQAGPSGQRYAIQCLASNAVFDTINFNGYYTAAANPGYLGGNLATLAAIQTAYLKNTNSFVSPAAALFKTATDMHIDTTQASNITNWKNKGNPVTTYSDDIDLTTRNGYTPDVGADEWVEGRYGSWVGRTSIDWLVPSNWEANVVPDRGTDVFITGGYSFMPTIVTTQAVRNLALSSPVPPNIPLLTLNNGTLQVYGTITRTGGSVDGSNGTLEMDSNIVSQPIPASLFVNNNLKNLIANNSSSPGVSINGTLDIYRSVTFGASGVNLTTNSNLVFKSTATETAWLGNVTGKTISGTATVERYIATGLNHSKTWQLLGVPVKGTTSIKASWMENNGSLGNIKPGYGTTFSSEVAGATGRGWDFYTPIVGVTGGPSIKTYVPASGTWAGIDNGVALTSATQLPSSGAVNPAKAYFVFVRGDRGANTVSAPAVPTVLRCSGTLYTTGAGNTPPNTAVLAGKFALVANPYASAIDFTLVGRTAGVDNVFYVWDPLLYGSHGLGGYQTISSVTGYLPTPGSTLYPAGTPVKKIQSGQAFFVHGTAAGTVSFTEAAKVSGSSLVTKQTLANRGFFRVNLYKSSAVDNGPADGNVLAIDKDDFTNAFDKRDALKIENTSENIGIMSNGKLLAVEARKSLTKNDTVFYNISNLRTDAYQLRFGPENLQLNNNLRAYLVDRFLHTTTEVSLTDSTMVDFSITADAGSYQPDRFYLIFKRVETVPAFSRISAIPSGEVANTGASILVHPNPVLNKLLTVSFNRQSAGAYHIELSNKMGQVILKKTLQVNASNFTESIKLNSEVAAGNYQLTVTAWDGKKTVHQVIVQ